MKKKLAIVLGIVYALSLLWLSSTWYHTYTGFHFFNDLLEWEYLDKIGHFFTSFYIGLFAYRGFGDAQHLNPAVHKKWVCFVGFALLFPIEILDGFSMNYGASVFDLVANLTGSIFCFYHISGTLVSAITPKFSFHATAFAILRPELLGANLTQQVVKDYNGQTYWISIDINAMVGKKILPSWLLLTVGYGAEGLLGGHDNVWQNAKGETVDYSSITRAKRFFVSLDLNARALTSKNKWFSRWTAPFVLLKFPAPTVEVNEEKGLVFHWLYF